MPNSLLISRLQLLKNIGFTPQTILDVGAYHGDWSREVFNLWPQSQFYALEANQDCASFLATLPFLTGYSIALLGDKVRNNVAYYTTPFPITTGNSIYPEQTQFFSNPQVRRLPMTTLDLLLANLHLPNIDFIKIDTQGSELDIIKGGTKTLAQAHFVLLETSVLQYNLGAPSTEAVIAKMSTLGFQIFDITEIHYLPTGETAQIDILFVKQNSRYIRRGTLL